MNKQKFLIVFLVAIICALIATGCYLAFNYFTTPNTTTEIITEILFKASNYPKVDGSTATIPLAEAFQSNFTGEEVEIKHSKTHQAYEKLIDGECDLILVVEPSEDEINYAKEEGVELEYTKVVNEGFVFFINANNPVESLTLEQIQKIYTGEITNWKEVGGNDEEIIAYQRPENSGSQTGMLSLVMKGLELTKAPTENIAAGMADIIDVVSDYENGAGSIGYSYYYYANTIYLSDNIKLLKVNGVEPNNKTIGSESYPILTAYYVVTRANEPKNSDTTKLKDAMMSERGQKVAETAGYVPISK